MRVLHDEGRMTARERVEALLDDGSFVEIDALARHRSTAFKLDKSRPVTDGVVSGHGTIDGRPVCVFSQDSSIFDGQLGEVTGEKIVKVLELAIKSGTPIIGLYDSTGSRAKEGIVTLEKFSQIYRLQALASGVIPQVAVAMGEVSGPNAHSVALADVVINVANQSSVSLSAGSSSVSDATSGLAHLTSDSEHSACDLVAEILSYLPSNNRAIAPAEQQSSANDAAEGAAATDDSLAALDSIVPDADGEAFDMEAIIRAVVDADSFLQLQPVFARSFITGFGRVDGRSIGIIANQPEQGDIDSDAAEKAARFIRLCNAFNVPLISFVDAPGFAETDTTVRRTAKLVSASADASVGKIVVVVRRAFGSAYLALAAKKLGNDLVFAWPTAQIAVAEATELAAAVDTDVAALPADLVSPYAAAERGLVDAVIPPSHTRRQLSDGLRLLERKVEDSYARKHNNMPL